MSPVISVGMPVYNAERFLGEAIESILSQTYSDFELIISDNASTDGTADICAGFAQRDSRIRIFRQSINLGVARNYNYVFTQSSGTYFRWASANDLCAPVLLQICKDVLDRHSEVVLCFGETDFIGDKAQVYRHDDASLALTDARPSDRFIHLLEHLNLNTACGGVFRSDALRKTRLERPYPGGDLVLLAELALHGSFHKVPDCLFFRRMSVDTATSCRSKDQILQMYYPGSTSRFFWPEWSASFGYLDAVRRSPIGISAKSRLLCYLAKTQFYWRKGRLWREFFHNLLASGKAARGPQSVAVHGDSGASVERIG